MENKNKQKIVRFDWAIKHILRNKANFDIIEGFLAALLNGNSISVLEIIESESNRKEEDDKFNRVDILVKDGYDRRIIIEIQNTRESDYLERIIFGTSKTITESIELGDSYKNISKVISISILYFNLGIGDDYLYYGETIFKGLTKEQSLNRLKAVLPHEKRFAGINKFPEYYLIQVEKYQNIVERAIDEWIYWFKNESIAEDSKSKNIDKVSAKLSYLKMDSKEKRAYEEFLMRLASEKDMLETAKKDGRKEAENELIPQIEEAKAREEEAKAREEEAKAREVEAKANADETKIKLAKRMLKYGERLEDIIAETGLLEAEIENLK